MLYSQKIFDAINLMCEAHKDVIDKSGIPYIFHPYHLAEQMQTEDTVIAALLHDVMEDTDFTEDDLRARGITENVIDALRLLNHDDSTPYMDYVRALRSNEIARAVKIADITHNLDKSRMPKGLTENLMKKRSTYKEALAYLLKD